MECTKVTAVFFSGTGTTEKIVRTTALKIAHELNIKYEEINISFYEIRKKAFSFEEKSLVIAGVPTYAGRVPNVLLPFLKGNLKGMDTMAVPMVLYGNRSYDDALIELRDILQNNGFKTIAAAAFVGEHAFSDTLAAGRPDEEDIKAAENFAEKICEKIKELEVPPQKAVDVKGCEPLRPYYTPRDRNGGKIDILKVKPKTNDNCDNCGLCAEICPMKAIDETDVSLITGTCIKCCACIKKCHLKAKYFEDEGFLYHKKELEDMYGKNRCECEIFVGI